MGALDGKHVVVIKPAKTGSTFLNYKQTFSIVLMAIVDAHYLFRYVTVGAQGRISDAGVFTQCKFAKSLENNELGFPQPTAIPGSDIVAPYMLLADDAFPLRCNIMKPFYRRCMAENERIFNYRLSRARRIVENAFGILSARFRIFRAPIALKVPTVRQVVLAAISLHNFLRRNRMDDCEAEDTVDVEDVATGEVIDGNWRSLPERGALRQLRCVIGRLPNDAKQLRIQLAHYFLNEGAVEWQWKMAGLVRPMP